MAPLQSIYRMEWKTQFIAFALYLGVIVGGFVFIPKEPPMFGMGMIPGPSALFSVFALPIIAALAIGVALFLEFELRKGINTAFFLVASVVVWLLAFFLFH